MAIGERCVRVQGCAGRAVLPSGMGLREPTSTGCRRENEPPRRRSRARECNCNLATAATKSERARCMHLLAIPSAAWAYFFWLFSQIDLLSAAISAACISTRLHASSILRSREKSASPRARQKEMRDILVGGCGSSSLFCSSLFIISPYQRDELKKSRILKAARITLGFLFPPTPPTQKERNKFLDEQIIFEGARHAVCWRVCVCAIFCTEGSQPANCLHKRIIPLQVNYF